MSTPGGSETVQNLPKVNKLFIKSLTNLSRQKKTKIEKIILLVGSASMCLLRENIYLTSIYTLRNLPTFLHLRKPYSVSFCFLNFLSNN